MLNVHTPHLLNLVNHGLGTYKSILVFTGAVGGAM